MRPNPICLFAPLAVLLAALSTDAHAQVQSSKLGNGLHVYHQYDGRRPRAAVAITYRVGSRDDPRGYHSLAHLVEHLMFQGSTNVGEDGFFRHLELAGSTSHGGFTTWDETTYVERVPATRLATALWLESDRMGLMLGHLGQRTLDVQREVVRNEWRERGGGSVAACPLPVLAEGLYPDGHPYQKGLANLEWQLYGVPDLDAIDAEHVAWFFQRWYRPSNATLAIVGDVPAARVIELVGKYFGPIRSATAEPSRTTGAPVRLEGLRHIEVRAPSLRPRVLVAWPTGPLGTPGHEALTVVAEDLRRLGLHQRLVAQGKVKRLAVTHTVGELDSLFVIDAVVSHGTSKATVERIIDEEVGALRDHGITAPRFRAAKHRHLVSLLASDEALTGAAIWLSRHHEPLAARIARVRRLSRANLVAAARGYLPLDRRVVMHIDFDERAPATGRMRVWDETP